MRRASTPLSLLFSPIMTGVRALEERPDRLVSCTPSPRVPDTPGGAIVPGGGIYHPSKLSAPLGAARLHPCQREASVWNTKARLARLSGHCAWGWAPPHF